jgi:FkbM family methyltransferase
MSYLLRLIDKYLVKQPKVRRAVTRLIEKDRDLSVPLFGGAICLNTIKEHGYLRASRAVKWSSLLRDEVPVLLSLAMLMEDGDTFVDVGANVGVFSCTLARRRRLDANTRVFAFEANPDTYQRLIQSCQPCGVDAHHVAISDREGTLEFVGGAVSHVFTTVDCAREYNLMDERVTVPCRRLDSFDLPGSSLIIKIDVEKQERAVIDGAQGFFDSGRVKAVYLDGFHDKSIPDLLAGRGMTLFNGRTLAPYQSGQFSLLSVRTTDITIASG